MLTEDLAAVRDLVRRFADEAIRPVAAELDETETFPAQLYARMAELGLFGIGIPAELGGAGMGALAYTIVMEELSRGYASVADQCGLVELVGTLLHEHGTADQQERYLRPLLRAERRCAYAITEAQAGSDVSAIRTTASRSGSAGGSMAASYGSTTRRFATSRWCWPAPTVGRPSRHEHLPGRPRLRGVQRRPARAQDGPARLAGGCPALRCRRAAGDALLGPEGRGFHMMMSVLDKGRVGIASLAVGIAQAGLEAALGFMPGSAASSAGRSATTRACNGCSPTWPRNARRHACSPVTPPSGSRPASPLQWPARWPSASPPIWPWRRRPTPSRCSAGAATFAASRSSGSTATRRSARSTRAPTRSSATSSRASS